MVKKLVLTGFGLLLLATPFAVSAQSASPIGKISASLDASTPGNSIVIAGANDVNVGNFRFMASSSAFVVQELKVKIPASAAYSVSAVTLKWEGGPAGGVSQALVLPSGGQSHATATFVGLTFMIPMNEAKTIGVYVHIPTIQSGATSGAAIRVILDGNEGFKAVDMNGVSRTRIGSGKDINSAAKKGYGIIYVRKSKPVLSAIPLDSSVLTQGTNVALGRFSITADAAGKIDWKVVAFKIEKSPNLYLKSYALYQGANRIDGRFSTAADGTLRFNALYAQTVESGTSGAYELRATVSWIASWTNYVAVSIPSLSTSIKTGTFSNRGSFVWSDWSDLLDHSINPTGPSTEDWTNDYLVETLPLALSSLSMLASAERFGTNDYFATSLIAFEKAFDMLRQMFEQGKVQIDS